MDIFRRNQEEKKQDLEPIRGSVVILAIRLAGVMLFFEILFGAAFYALNLGFSLPFDLHHHIAELLFFMEIIKLILQLFFIVNITLSWSNIAYYLTGKHLTRKTGMFHVKEDLFHFDNIRSISVTQSFLGKIFNYGDITLMTSASGGYQEVVTISGVQNPKKYQQMIQQSL